MRIVFKGSIMTRMSKQSKKRAISPRKHKLPGQKSGSKKDKLTLGYKPHENALEGDNLTVFIGKVK
jgi:hypothetical protein